MDITCLQFLDIHEPYFFRKHHDMPAVGNLLKAPRGSELMKRAYEIAVVEVTEENRDWHKPIQILNDQIVSFKLEKCIDGTKTNRDWWTDIEKYLEKPKPIPKGWLALHWMNEEWRTRKISKSEYVKYSTYHNLLLKHSLAPALSRFENMVRKFRQVTNNFTG